MLPPACSTLPLGLVLLGSCTTTEESINIRKAAIDFKRESPATDSTISDHASINHLHHAGIDSHRVGRSFGLLFDGVCRLHQQLQSDLWRLLPGLRRVHDSIFYRPRLPTDNRLAIKHHASIRARLLLLDALCGQHQHLRTDIRWLLPGVRQLHDSFVHRPGLSVHHQNEHHELHFEIAFYADEYQLHVRYGNITC